MLVKFSSHVYRLKKTQKVEEVQRLSKRRYYIQADRDPIKGPSKIHDYLFNPFRKRAS